MNKKHKISRADPFPESGDWTVIGVDELGVCRGKEFERILLDDVEDVSAGEIKEGFKANLEELNIRTESIADWRVPTEKDSPAFAIWNIILMLVRMQRKG